MRTITPSTDTADDTIISSAAGHGTIRKRGLLLHAAQCAIARREGYGTWEQLEEAREEAVDGWWEWFKKETDKQCLVVAE